MITDRIPRPVSPLRTGTCTSHRLLTRETERARWPLERVVTLVAPYVPIDTAREKITVHSTILLGSCIERSGRIGCDHSLAPDSRCESVTPAGSCHGASISAGLTARHYCRAGPPAIARFSRAGSEIGRPYLLGWIRKPAVPRPGPRVARPSPHSRADVLSRSSDHNNRRRGSSAQVRRAL